MGDAAELLGGALQSFNLFAQARQLGLLLVQHFLDILHGKALLMAILGGDFPRVNESPSMDVTAVTGELDLIVSGSSMESRDDSRLGNPTGLLDLNQGQHFQQLAWHGNPCCEILLTFRLNALRINGFQSA
jgi:hypothetical protein